MKGTMDYLTRYRWLLLVSGIAATIFGIAALAWPGLTLAVLILLCARSPSTSDPGVSG